MKTEYQRVKGTENGIDFDAHYQCAGYRGIAWYLLGWAVEYRSVMTLALDNDGNEVEIESGEFEPEADTTRVVAVMVGDDRRFVFDLEDIKLITEDGFCRDCGQIGCYCNVYA